MLKEIAGFRRLTPLRDNYPWLPGSPVRRSVVRLRQALPRETDYTYPPAVDNAFVRSGRAYWQYGQRAVKQPVGGCYADRT